MSTLNVVLNCTIANLPPSAGPVCSSSISDMLIAVCLCILLAVAILYLLMPQQIYSTKTKHINIACILPCKNSQSCHDRTLYGKHSNKIWSQQLQQRYLCAGVYHKRLCLYVLVGAGMTWTVATGGSSKFPFCFLYLYVNLCLRQTMCLLMYLL